MRPFLRTGAGILALLLGISSHSFAQTFNCTWTNQTANASWFNATNWSPNHVPGSADTANITNFTPSLTNAAASVGALNLSGGTLNAGTNGLLIVSGGTWSGGVIAGAVTVSNSATWVLNNPGGNLDLPGALFYNFGQVQWLAGTLRGNGSTYIYNDNQWVVNATNATLNNAYGGTPSFVNYVATLLINSTNGGTTFTGVTFQNVYASSVVDVKSGSLQLGGGGSLQGTVEVDAGATFLLTQGAFTATNLTFTGPGVRSLTGGSLLLSTPTTLPGLTLAGGTVTLGPSFQNAGAITNLTLNGSTLAGTNTVTGTLNWQAGGISGVFNIAPSGILDLGGSGPVILYATLTNAGQILWNGAGDWEVYNDNGANHGAIANLSTGVILAQCNNNISSGYGDEWFNNAGLFTKLGSTNTTVVVVAFTNTGTVSVQSGTLTINHCANLGGNFVLSNGTVLNLLANTGGSILGGVFSSGFGAKVNLAGGTFTQSPTLSFTGTGAASLASGVLNLTTASVPNLQYNGGTLNLPAGIQNGVITNLTMTYSGENLAGSNYVTGVLNLEGNINGPLVIAPGGVVNWMGGAIYDGVIISAGGVFNILGPNQMDLESMTNAGMVNWTGGNLTLYGGTTSYNLAGGVFNIECDHSLNLYNGNETFNNAGTLEKSGTTGTTYIYVAFINSGSVVAQTGTLDFEYYENAVPTILGGNFLAQNGATIGFYDGGNISGDFTAAAGGTINLAGGTFIPAPSLVFNGPGTNLLTAGTFTLNQTNLADLNVTGGLVYLAPGFQGGAITNLSLRASLYGTNVVTGVLNLVGNVEGPLTVASNAVLNLSGIIYSNLTLLPGSVLNWTNGSLQVPLTIPSNAVVNVVGGTGDLLFESTVTNAGVLNWVSGYFDIYSGTVYNQAGAVINIQSISGTYYSDGGTLANAGLVRKWMNAGTSSIYWSWDNVGEVDVQTGTLQLYGRIQISNRSGLYLTESGAGLTFSDGGYLTGEFTAAGGATNNFASGTFTNTTSTVLDGAGVYNLNGATFNLLYDLPANLNLVSGFVNPGAAFQGGSITNLNLGTLSITGSNFVTGVLNLSGNISGPLTAASGATVSAGGNIGSPVTLQSGATLNWQGGSATLSEPLNIAAGAVMNMANAQSSEIYDTTLTNSGTINWTTGYLQLTFGGIYNQAGANFNILTDSTIYQYEGQGYEYIVNNGTFLKTGSTGVTLVNPDFTNNGVIDAESGRFLFSYQTFSQTGGIWDIGINGLSNNGVIAFAYAAPLPGTLNVTVNNNYILGPGETFNLVDYASSTGNLSTTNLPTDGVTWQLTRSATNLNLVAAAVAAPSVSITSPANNAYLVAPGGISITGTATPASVPITSIQIYQGTNLLGQIASSPFTFNWPSVAPGLYTLDVRAIDANGATGTSAPVNITVVSAGPQPTNYTWIGTASSTDWFSAANWSPAVVPGVLDTAIIANGALASLSHNATVSSVILSSGTLGGTGALTVTNLFTWTGGVITNTLVIPSNGVLAINSASTVSLASATLINQGLVDWLQGTLIGNATTVISNNGLWLALTDNAMTLGTTAAGGLFVNNGVFRKGAATGQTVLGGQNFTNAGLVDVQSGSVIFNSGGTLGGAYNTASNSFIQFHSGAFTLNAPPVFSGLGSSEFTGGTLTLVHDAPASLLLNSGVVILGAGFQNGGAITNLVLNGSTLSGTNSITGVLTCLNATVIGGPSGGALTVEPNGLLVFGSTNPPTYSDVGFENLRLLNLGEVICQSAELYDYDDITTNSQVTNNSLWLFTGNLYNDEAYDFSFVNNGTIRSITTGSVYVQNPSFVNNGTLDSEAGIIDLSSGGGFPGAFVAAAGASIIFNAGTNIVNAPPNFTGQGSFQFTGGTLILNHDIIPGLNLTGGNVVLGPAFQNGGAINNLTLDGATLVGTNVVTGNLFCINSATFSGPLTVNAGASLIISNCSATITSGSFTNFGSVLFVGSSASLICDASPPGFVVNNGLWLDQANSSQMAAVGTANMFVNNGTYRKEAASGQVAFNVAMVNSNGLLDIRAGLAYLQDGGVLAGTYNVAAAASLDLYAGNFTAGRPAPVFSGAGSSSLVEYATLTLQADQIPGLNLSAGTVMVGSGFQKNGTITNLTLTGATLAGTNAVSGSLTLFSPSQVSGRLTILSNGLMTISGTTASGGVSLATGATLLNQGVVDWTSNSVYLYPSTTVTNAGLWLDETDNTIENINYYNSSNTLLVNTGTFTKTTTSGVTICYGVYFLNSGNLDIESGSLNLAANYYNHYAQTGATLTFGISAPNVAGRLLLSTNVSFDGTLVLNPLNGYMPQLGDFLPVISANSATGSFANLALPVVSGGNAWNVQYEPTGVNLLIVPGVTNVSPYTISGLVLDDSSHPVAGAVIYVTETGSTNLLQNGSFELPQLPLVSPGYALYSPGSTNLQGWTITGPTNDNVSLVDGYYSTSAEDGVQFLDPSGNTGGAGISQTFATVSGTTYELVFYHGTQTRHNLSAVLGVTIDTNYYTFGETDGSGNNYDWRRVQIFFTASGSQTTVAFSELTGANSDDAFIDNVQVIQPGLGATIQAVPGADGSYSLRVPNGSYQIGVSGLPAAGYNTVPSQTVVINNANGVANFTPTPSSGGQFLTITASVNSSALGTASGGGANFRPGAAVTVTAVQISNALPYYFAGWTENGVLQSTNLSYSFTTVRSRILVANFDLPGLLVSASNNPAGAGEVSGTGVYTYDTTNVLTAYPLPGYTFLNWSENGAVVSGANPLATLILTNHNFTANYGAGNPYHFVSGGTLPSANLAVVAGTGTYTNGQTTVVSVPAVVTNNNLLYIFSEFTLNGVAVATSPSFSKTFSTLDPTNLPYVAIYAAGIPLQPRIAGVSDNYANPVPATANFRLTFQFDRSMSTVTAPLVVLTNPAPGAVQAVVGANGVWSSRVFINDTYQTPGITFGAGMDGSVQVLISRAQDIYGHALPVTVATNLIVLSTPPPAPVAVITSPTNGAIFYSTNSFTITATAGSATNPVQQVDFYANGVLLGVSGSVPYHFNAAGLPAGNYALTAVAVDPLGLMATSRVVQVTVNVPGTAVINFDALDASGGGVGGAALSNYLAGFGVRAAGVTVGTVLEAVSGGVVTGAGGAVAASPPNYLTQAGLSTPVSYTLVFASPLQSLGLTRVGLLAGAGGVSHPQWQAVILGVDGTALGSAGEDLLQSGTNVPARSFVLTGAAAIGSVQVSSDSRQTASFSAALLDDFILSANAAAPSLAVTLLPPVVSGPGPVSIPLTADVIDSLGGSYSVSYYAGPTLIGNAPSAPYTLVWSNVLAGSYSVRAQVVDVSGQTVYSAAVSVVVGAGGNAQVVDFDSLNAAQKPVTGAALNAYLAQYGMSVASASAGTQLAVESQGLPGGGGLVAASSPPNVLTQIGSNGPVSCTIDFAGLLSGFGFTRPALLAAPVASHPAWTATAYDAAGVVLAQVGEAAILGYTNVGARAFNLAGPGIASVQLASQGTGLGALNALVADDFVLTTNVGGAPFPPAVALSSPADGLQLTGQVGLPVSAVAVDAAGVSGVGFYANGLLIGSALAAPYGVVWTNGGAGSYVLTAVATNLAGLTRTSPPVSVSVLPPAYEFGLASQPVGQLAATGGTAVFTVSVTGTNAVTYQWFQNNQALGGQTGSSLTLGPLSAASAGTYTVQASSGGLTLTSAGAVLQVLDPPVFTTQPAGVVAAAGSNILLTNQVDGDGPLTWQWLLNGTSIAGATNRDYAIAAAQPLSSGHYQVVVANPVAFSVSAVAPVTVSAGGGSGLGGADFAGRAAINPLLGAVGGDNTASPATGELGQIAGKPAGRFLWYTWQADFTGVISLTTLGSDFDTLLGVYTGSNVNQLVKVAEDDDSGGYFTSLVTFNVTAGTVYQIAVAGFQGASGQVILGMPAGTGYRVLNPGAGGSVPVILSQPASQLAQAGGKATLVVGAANAQTYQWFFQGAPVHGGTAATLVLTNFQAGAVGLYDVLAANAAGSARSEPASVQIVAAGQGGTNAAHDKFGDAVDLAGGSAPRPASGGGDTRGYSVSQIFSTVGATKEPGEPDPCGQTGGASQWYVYTAPAAGTLRVSTAGSSFNTLLAVYTGPGTNFASLVSQACGYTTNYQSQGQPDVVVPGVVAGTRYYIMVDGYQGASGQARLQIGLGRPPALVSGPASQFATAGSNATFSVGAAGSTNLFYQWQFNGANVARATGASYTVTNAQAGAAGSYTVVVSNVVGVVTSAPPATLILQFAPGINTSPAGQTVTLGQKAVFTVAAAGVNTKADPFHFQWSHNGAVVAGAAGPSLALAAAQWTNQGSYQVVISNSYGAATSAVAVLVTRDLVAPTVAITNPAVNNLVVQTNGFTVQGTAGDNAGVAGVRVQVNNNHFQTALGSNRWSLAVSLIPGTNVLTVQSVDLAGNTNTVPARRNIIYLVSSVLTVNTNGTGGVTSPDKATNGATLVLGRDYVLTAVPTPKSGWLFDHWSGGGASLGAANPLTFVMTSNLVLTANFVTNPFPAVAGNYNGLFYPSNGVTEAGSGFFTASVVSNGAGFFTAQLMLDGVTYHNPGAVFTPSGQSQWLIPRAAAAGGPVLVGLDLDLNPAAGRLTGTVSNATWLAQLQADRAVFNAATAPAINYTGQFTVLLPPGAGAPLAAPGGFGYAAISNSPGGLSAIQGALADGTPFSQSVPIAQDGSIPLYASLYGQRGSLLGWLTFTNQPPKTVAGSVNWIKPAAAKTLYPQGFNLALPAVLGSGYINPPAGVPVLDLPAATLTLVNGNLPAALVYNVGLTANQFTNLNPAGPTNYLNIQLNRTNGVLTVTFRATGAGTNTTGRAAILQNQGDAMGAFPGPTQTGAILIR